MEPVTSEVSKTIQAVPIDNTLEKKVLAAKELLKDYLNPGAEKAISFFFVAPAPKVFYKFQEKIESNLGTFVKFRKQHRKTTIVEQYKRDPELVLTAKTTDISKIKAVLSKTQSKNDSDSDSSFSIDEKSTKVKVYKLVAAMGVSFALKKFIEREEIDAIDFILANRDAMEYLEKKVTEPK
jgi:hypothetical protein